MCVQGCHRCHIQWYAIYVWSREPGTGGVKIPELVQHSTTRRLLRHIEQNYLGRYNRLDIRYRGALCYINAYVVEGTSGERLPHDEVPTHLCRLRYFGHEDRWAFAFFTYSNMKYELAMFPNGSFYGTPEEALDASSMYL